MTDLLAAAAGRTVILTTHRRDHLDRFDQVLETLAGRQARSYGSLEVPGAPVAG